MPLTCFNVLCEVENLVDIFCDYAGCQSIGGCVTTVNNLLHILLVSIPLSTMASYWSCRHVDTVILDYRLHGSKDLFTCYCHAIFHATKYSGLHKISLLSVALSTHFQLGTLFLSYFNILQMSRNLSIEMGLLKYRIHLSTLVNCSLSAKGPMLEWKGCPTVNFLARSTLFFTNSS